MRKLRTAETLALTDRAAGIIRRHGLETCALHVGCHQKEGDPYYVGIRVSTLAQLLAWRDLHDSVPVLTVFQSDKGTNVYYHYWDDENVQWNVWMHAPGVTIQDLLPGVDTNAKRNDDSGFLVGQITSDDLRSVVNRCTCGDPAKPGSVHRADGPCHVAESGR